MPDEIFGLQPVMLLYAMYVRKHDLILVSDGRAMPTFDFVIEDAANDPDDEDYCLIDLISQRTLRVAKGLQVMLARKGTNLNAI